MEGRIAMQYLYRIVFFIQQAVEQGKETREAETKIGDGLEGIKHVSGVSGTKKVVILTLFVIFVIYPIWCYRVITLTDNTQFSVMI